MRSPERGSANSTMSFATGAGTAFAEVLVPRRARSINASRASLAVCRPSEVCRSKSTAQWMIVSIALPGVSSRVPEAIERYASHKSSAPRWGAAFAKEDMLSWTKRFSSFPRRSRQRRGSDRVCSAQRSRSTVATGATIPDKGPARVPTWPRIASHRSDVCNSSSDRFTGRQSSRLRVNERVLRRSPCSRPVPLPVHPVLLEPVGQRLVA